MDFYAKEGIFGSGGAYFSVKIYSELPEPFTLSTPMLHIDLRGKNIYILISDFGPDPDPYFILHI